VSATAADRHRRDGKRRADDDRASSPGAGAKGVFGLSVDFLRRHLLDGESSGLPDGWVS
jgi:hypothetical protein